MNKDKMTEDNTFALLAALAEDALIMEIGELDSALTELGRNPEAADHHIAQAIGRARLQLAKADVAQSRLSSPIGTTGHVVDIRPGTAKENLLRIAKKNVDANTQLTMAAREERDLSESDAVSLLEDLVELGVIDADDLR